MVLKLIDIVFYLPGVWYDSKIYSSPSLSALVFAKEFRERKSGQRYQYTQNRLESLGNKLQWLVGKSSDTLLREIKNPVTIIALTTLALFSVTIAFYPSSALLVAAKVLPPFQKSNHGCSRWHYILQYKVLY